MDENCVFCDIVAGRLPSYKVYEDHDILAFLDINPLAPGHTLVIPKKHYVDIFDIPVYPHHVHCMAIEGMRVALDCINPGHISFPHRQRN